MGQHCEKLMSLKINEEIQRYDEIKAWGKYYDK